MTPFIAILRPAEGADGSNAEDLLLLLLKLVLGDKALCFQVGEFFDCLNIPDAGHSRACSNFVLHELSTARYFLQLGGIMDTRFVTSRNTVPVQT